MADLAQTRQAIARVNTGKNVNEDSWMTLVVIFQLEMTVFTFRSPLQHVVQHELGRPSPTCSIVNCPPWFDYGHRRQHG